MGELVQNSLDAGASRIEIEWFNSEGKRALRIWDDGQGIFPDREREEALLTIAKTIGHSHKRDLNPAERREQMVLGQYGIGLIGFWSVGKVLEIKSRVAGGKLWVLRLREDRATGEVFPSRTRNLGEEATYTEVTIREIHSAAQNRIRPPRLQAYLASELRGQLLEREATVRIRDRVARGRARKLFVVEPRPYLGLPLDEWRELEVPGFESARVELYLVAPDDGRRGVVSLACGGAVVMDDIALIEGDDAPREPWNGGRLEGVIDFPELHVAPGSRRGFSHDEPVAAFMAALSGLESEIRARMEQEDRRREQAHQEDVARQIRRAFRSVIRNLSDYDFFGVRGDDGGSGSGPGTKPEGGAAEPGSRPAGAGTGEGEPVEKLESEPEPSSAPESPACEREAARDTLFPPGPFARLELTPKRLRLSMFETRGLRARALDSDGRPCAGPVAFEWQLHGPGQLEREGAAARYTAPDRDQQADIRVHVVAVQGETTIEAECRVQLVARPGSNALLQGIPEPHPVAAPGQNWRSRLRAGKWEYNEAHPDYRAVAETESRRLRYLVHLLTKELVLRNFGGPGDEEALERMVEILTHLDLGRVKA